MAVNQTKFYPQKPSNVMKRTFCELLISNNVFMTQQTFPKLELHVLIAHQLNFLLHVGYHSDLYTKLFFFIYGHISIKISFIKFYRIVLLVGIISFAPIIFAQQFKIHQHHELNKISAIVSDNATFNGELLSKQVKCKI